MLQINFCASDEKITNLVNGMHLHCRFCRGGSKWVCPYKKQLHAADVHNQTGGRRFEFNKLTSTFTLSIFGVLFPGLKMRWRTKITNMRYAQCTLLPMPLSKGSFQGKGNTIFLILRKIHVIAKKRNYQSHLHFSCISEVYTVQCW